jgi:2-deoxy-scyllo-inosamine dehydrogenase (SAM-dependent)
MDWHVARKEFRQAFLTPLKHLLLYGDAKFPEAIAIEVGTHCNRACPYCTQSVDKQPTGWMSDRVLDAVSFRLRQLYFTGTIFYSWRNEPLLRKDLEEVVARFKQDAPAARHMIYTNGDALTDDRMRKLIVAGMSEFVVTRHPPFSDEWDRRIAFLKQMYPRHVSLRGSIVDSPWLMNYAGTVNIPNKKSMGWCNVPNVHFQILANGDVPLCCALPRRDVLVMGNVLEESILAIWGKPQFKELRQQAASGNPSEPICRRCLCLEG